MLQLLWKQGLDDRKYLLDKILLWSHNLVAPTLLYELLLNVTPQSISSVPILIHCHVQGYDSYLSLKFSESNGQHQ